MAASSYDEVRKDFDGSQIYENLKKATSQIFPLENYGYCTSIVGIRASGKTHLANYLIDQFHKQRSYTACFLFSATSDVQDTQTLGFLPKSHRFQTLEPMLSKIMATQREVVEINKHVIKHHTSKGRPDTFIPSRLCIILDDFSSMQSRTSQQLLSICTHGRHLGFSWKGENIALVDTFFLAQDVTQLHPVAR